MSDTIEFPMIRADWVALSVAVARRPLAFRLMTVAALLSLLVVVTAFVSGSGGGSMLADLLKGGSEWYPFYAFVAVFAVALLWRHHLVGFNAAANFARMPLADKVLTVVLGDDDVHVTAQAFDWRFPWAAVSRVVEIPSHLVIATSGREGLPIPRRAFADPAAFDRVRALVLQHLPKEAVHECP